MALLNLNKLTVRFGGLTAVENVDCAVNDREIYSIIGPNGAGKTTVFNAVTGIYEPTSGTIEFTGHGLRRPFTWQVALTALAIGLATGLAAALVAVDVNALWRATIKRNYAGPGNTFSYRAAWDDAWNYLDGKLALEPARGNRWGVRTADGRATLGFGNTREQAEQLRSELDQIVVVAHSYDKGFSSPIVERDGKWQLVNGDRTLRSFDSEADARAFLDKFVTIAREPDTRKRRATLAFLAGLLIGAAGTLAVWNRARCTPEVVSRAGIARTFQNIRLFRNMTVRDNVLVGIDRKLHGGVVRMALQTPAIRRQERHARAEADRLLDFVGLADKGPQLAKNLPYGDQRRLEIARALATGPRLILLDEPAAGMNPSESIELNGLIEQIRGRGLAVMLIEHHMSVVMGISDRIAVLEYGRKIAEGTPEAVRNDPRVIAAYLGSEEVT